MHKFEQKIKPIFIYFYINIQVAWLTCVIISGYKSSGLHSTVLVYHGTSASRTRCYHHSHAKKSHILDMAKI